jgi:hypothetical protein
MRVFKHIQKIIFSSLIFFVLTFLVILVVYYINLGTEAGLLLFDSETYYSFGAIIIFSVISIFYLRNLCLVLWLALLALPLYFLAAFFSLCSIFKNCL